MIRLWTKPVVAETPLPDTENATYSVSYSVWQGRAIVKVTATCPNYGGIAKIRTLWWCATEERPLDYGELCKVLLDALGDFEYRVRFDSVG